jgi:hypothetical protein
MAAASSSISARPAIFSRQVVLPALAILAYAAFLVTGFDNSLSVTSGNDTRAVPLYVFYAVLLLALQGVISRGGGLGQTIYVALSSLVTLVFAAGGVFFNHHVGLFQQPGTYVVLNALTYVVFVVGAFAPQAPTAKSGDPTGAGSAQSSVPPAYARLAADFGGVAVVGYIAWVLNAQLVSGVLGVSGLATLQMIDRDIAVGATALALVVVVILGLLVSAATPAQGQAPINFVQALGRVLGAAADQGGRSLRLVLSPLVWFVPSISIAEFAQRTTLNLAQASTSTGSVLGLFNPFGPAASQNYGAAAVNLGLGALSVVSVIVAVAIIEYNLAVVNRTLQVVAEAGLAVGLTFVLFLVSLAVINAFLLLVIPNFNQRPFQLGASTLVSLAVAVALIAYSAARPSPSNRA